MCYLLHITAAVFFLSFFSCGSTHKNKASGKNVDSTTSSSFNRDTIPQTPPPLKPEPGPGQIQLKGKILSSKQVERDSSVTIKIRVINVLGMGAATPAVGPGAILQILSTEQSEKIQKGTIIICTIQHQQVLKNKEPPNIADDWLLMQLQQN